MLNAGIVGLGPMGGLHGAIANGSGTSKVVAVADADERLLKLVPKLMPGIKTFRDAGTMIRSINLDTLYVCTPAHVHGEIVHSVIDSGSRTAVFVEKPLATNKESASDLAQLVKKARTVSMVGYQKRFNGAYLKARSLIETGTIGRPLFFRAHSFTGGVLKRESGWKYEMPSGGAALEWGVHLFDLLNWLFGEPRPVRATRRRIFSETVEDYAQLEIEYPDGVSGHAEIGWSMRNYNPDELMIEVHGSEGMLNVNQDRILLSRDNLPASLDGVRSEMIHVSTLTPKVPFLLGQPEGVLQDLHFQECAVAGRSPMNSFEESIALHALVDFVRAAPLA
jgi:predicted dehydrogenase